MRDMKEFFQFAQISKPPQRRLIDYFNATWSKRKVRVTLIECVNSCPWRWITFGYFKGMQQVHSTIQTFPDNLRGEIYQHLHKEFLNLPGNGFRMVIANFNDI